MKKLAIFDIDGTIFRSSLLIEVTNALIAEGVFPASTRKMYQRAFDNWLNREDSYGKYIAVVVVAFYTHIRGVPPATFRRVVKKVIAYHKHRVYRYTRDLVKQLRQRKYFLLAISHSPADLVAEFGKYFGFYKVYGRLMHIGNDGKLTGHLPPDDPINDKAKILKRAVARHNLSLRGSIGLGDSESDIPFLKMIDKPIYFNPNGKLYRYAKRAGWKVVVERKDVIYHL